MKLPLLLIAGIFISNIAFAQTYAILADRLIDCKSETSLDHPMVLVRQGKIVAVGNVSSIPDSASSPSRAIPSTTSACFNKWAS
jgi:hypothetical protein